MKTSAFLHFWLLLLLPVALLAQRPPSSREQVALERLEKINLDPLLSKKQVVNSLVSCVLDEGPCDGLGKQIKDLIPYGIEDKCDSCTKEQREKIFKIAKTLKHHYPHHYQSVMEKFNKGEEPEEFAKL